MKPLLLQMDKSLTSVCCFNVLFPVSVNKDRILEGGVRDFLIKGCEKYISVSEKIMTMRMI